LGEDLVPSLFVFQQLRRVFSLKKAKEKKKKKKKSCCLSMADT